MTQQTLFADFDSRELVQPAAKASEQAAQLDRVASNIAETIVDFLWLRGTGGTFTGTELQAFVAERHPTAPASADRILRDLRQQNRVQYSVQRAKSLYQILYLGD